MEEPETGLLMMFINPASPIIYKEYTIIPVV